MSKILPVDHETAVLNRNLICKPLAYNLKKINLSSKLKELTALILLCPYNLVLSSRITICFQKTFEGFSK